MDDPTEPTVLTCAHSISDIAQIVYGFELRGIKVEAIESRTGAIQVRLLGGDETVARASVEHIWDAVLEGVPRAVDTDGNCVFCGYGVAGLSRPATCPECGRSLDSIRARIAARDRQRPPPEKTRGTP